MAPNHSLRSGSGQGLKIRRVGPEGTTRYYHDGIRPIWEADGAGSMTAQLDRDIFGNLVSRKEPAGTRRYYHFDGLGSTTALSDEALTFVFFTLYNSSMKSRVSSKGQVTIPAEVRNRLGLQPGTVVVFEVREKGALIRKGSSGEHPVDRLYGRLRLRKPTNVLLDEMRGPRPRVP